MVRSLWSPNLRFTSQSNGPQFETRILDTQSSATNI